MPSKSQKAKKSIKNINSIIFCANKYLTESWRPIKFHKKTYQVYFVKFDGPVFSGGFWQISLKLSLYVKNWRKQNAFFSILGLIKSSPNSLGPPGTLWDPFGPPLGGPRGGIKVGVQKESCSDHYSEQLSGWTLTSFPPLGPSGTP